MVANIVDALSAYSKSGGASLAKPAGGAAEDGASGANFADTLKDFVGDTVGALKEGEKAAYDGATGKADVASIVTAINKAEVMLQTVVAIRDKVIAAYQDISRTQV